MEVGDRIIFTDPAFPEMLGKEGTIISIDWGEESEVWWKADQQGAEYYSRLESLTRSEENKGFKKMKTRPENQEDFLKNYVRIIQKNLNFSQVLGRASRGKIFYSFDEDQIIKIVSVNNLEKGEATVQCFDPEVSGFFSNNFYSWWIGSGHSRTYWELTLIDEVNIDTNEDPEKEMVKDQMNKDKDMSTRKDRFKKQVEGVSGAVKLGIALEGVHQGGELLLDIARKMGKNNPFIRDLLETEEGREALKLFMALMLNTIAHQFPNQVPKQEGIIKVTELQMTVSTQKLLSPYMTILREMLTNLGDLGDNIPDELTSLPSFSEAFQEIEETETVPVDR